MDRINERRKGTWTTAQKESKGRGGAKPGSMVKSHHDNTVYWWPYPALTQQQHTYTQGTIARLDTDLKAAHAQLAAQSQEHAQQQQAGCAEGARMQGRIDQLQSCIAQLDAALDAAREQLAAQAQQQQTGCAERGHLQSRIEQLEEELEDASVQLVAQAQLHTQQQEAAHNVAGSQQSRINELETELEDARTQLAMSAFGTTPATDKPSAAAASRQSAVVMLV